MKTLVTRTITGVFFVAALVGCVVWSETSFALFFALIAGLGVWEFSLNVNRHASKLCFVPPLCRYIALFAH